MSTYKRIREEIDEIAARCGRNPSDITLVVVSKMHTLEEMLPLYEEGCRDFGESRVQEAFTKLPEAPKDINWHLIGSLQRKKVPKVIGHFSMIHSVDSVELAQKISSSSENAGITTSIFLEANTSSEEAKHGLTPAEWKTHFEEIDALPALKVEGLMTMAPLTDDEARIRTCFRTLRTLRDELGLKHLSMGMTNDYPIAIEEGATFLRIGTALFAKKTAL